MGHPVVISCFGIPSFGGRNYRKKKSTSPVSHRSPFTWCRCMCTCVLCVKFSQRRLARYNSSSQWMDSRCLRSILCCALVFRNRWKNYADDGSYDTKSCASRAVRRASLTLLDLAGSSRIDVIFFRRNEICIYGISLSLHSSDGKRDSTNLTWWVSFQVFEGIGI